MAKGKLESLGTQEKPTHTPDGTKRQAGRSKRTHRRESCYHEGATNRRLIRKGGRHKRFYERYLLVGQNEIGPTNVGKGNDSGQQTNTEVQIL